MKSFYVLIDNDDMVFLKAVPSITQGEYWADILAPHHDYKICGLENKNYSCYTPYELRLLYHNTTGQAVPEDIEYNKLIKGVVDLASQLEVDETQLETLHKRLGREPSKPVIPKGSVRAQVKSQENMTEDEPNPWETGAYDPEDSGEGGKPWETGEPETQPGPPKTQPAKKSGGTTGKAKAPPPENGATDVPGRPKPGSSSAMVWDTADQLLPTHPDMKDLKKAVVAHCVEEGVNQSTAGVQFAKWKKAAGL